MRRALVVFVFLALAFNVLAQERDWPFGYEPQNTDSILESHMIGFTVLERKEIKKVFYASSPAFQEIYLKELESNGLGQVAPELSISFGVNALELKFKSLLALSQMARQIESTEGLYVISGWSAGNAESTELSKNRVDVVIDYLADVCLIPKERFIVQFSQCYNNTVEIRKYFDETGPNFK